MNISLFEWPILIGAAMVAGSAFAELPSRDLARVAEIKAMLRPQAGFAETRVGNRTFWDPIAKLPDATNTIKRARQLLSRGLSVPDDSRFGDKGYSWGLEFRKNEGRLQTLALAEALENKGEFLPAIEEALDFYVRVRTWTGRFHDKDLACFSGKARKVELVNAHVSTMLASVLDVHRERLSAELRERVLRKLRERTIDIYLEMARDGSLASKYRSNWVHGTGNWAASCHSSMVGAIVQAVGDPQLRAEAIEFADRGTRGFIAHDFTADGLCKEGPGYWSYGFGCYARLCLWTKRATGSCLDLVPDIRWYRSAYESGYLRGMGPAFGDANGGSPSDSTLHLCELLWPGNDHVKNALFLSQGLESVLRRADSFKDVNAYVVNRKATAFRYPLRSWFPDEIAQLVCRPAVAEAGKGALYLAVQGGYNQRPHGHCDVGTYCIAIDGKEVMGDAGNSEYHDDSFGPNRFKSRMRNSWGHPVPVVGGKLQTPGKDACGKVLSTGFADAGDEIVYDLKGVYREAANLERLTRKLEYRRSDGTVVATDHVVFSGSNTFETAFITYGKIRRAGENEFVFTSKGGKASARCRIEVAGAKWHFKEERLPEVAGSQFTKTAKGLAKPWRGAIVLDVPVREATVRAIWTK